MIRPPTIAPATDSNPPRISTGSALSAVKVSANCTPLRAPQRRPDTKATKPATVQTITQICCSGMPTASAAWWSSATARSALPMRVFWKNSASPATNSPATSAANRSNWLMNMPVFSDSHSNGMSVMPSSSPCGCEPQNNCASPSSTKVRPMVAMNSVIGGWFTSGRSTTRSVAMAIRTMAAKVIRKATQKLKPFSTSETKVSAAKNTIAP